MQITPLESWIARKIGLPNKHKLSMRALRTYQLARLNATLTHAAINSPFYRSRLTFEPLEDLAELSGLPFTSSTDLVDQGLQMLAVSQSEIERIVTLRSSGTTGQPKRLYFTREDLACTQDFFRCGMSQMLKPGHRVLVLLPGDLPDSAGRLLADALALENISCHVAGVVTSPASVAKMLVEEHFDCVVGIPVQVLSVVRHPDAAQVPLNRIRSVFLTSDYVPAALVAEIRKTWGCPAINHYGMTELGLTGGVECQALAGYHLREPELYFEVIDPLSDVVLPVGEMGEVVVTTLTRTGMPLIRYRTGDLARFIPEPCPCGSVLPRLSKLHGRLAGQIDIGGPFKLGMPELDEALFDLPDLINFSANLASLDSGIFSFHLTIEARPGVEKRTRDNVDRRLPTIPALRAALAGGGLCLRPTSLATQPLAVSATAKRLIEKPEKELFSLETIN